MTRFDSSSSWTSVSRDSAGSETWRRVCEPIVIPARCISVIIGHVSDSAMLWNPLPVMDSTASITGGRSPPRDRVAARRPPPSASSSAAR
jgi:hypothetical protein